MPTSTSGTAPQARPIRPVVTTSVTIRWGSRTGRGAAGWSRPCPGVAAVAGSRPPGWARCRTGCDATARCRCHRVSRGGCATPAPPCRRPSQSDTTPATAAGHASSGSADTSMTVPSSAGMSPGAGDRHLVHVLVNVQFRGRVHQSSPMPSGAGTATRVSGGDRWRRWLKPLPHLLERQRTLRRGFQQDDLRDVERILGSSSRRKIRSVLSNARMPGELAAAGALVQRGVPTRDHGGQSGRVTAAAVTQGLAGQHRHGLGPAPVARPAQVPVTGQPAMNSPR